MVVRTWNLFHGNTVAPGRRAFLREMIELITAGRPDVVCLQELPVWAVSRLESWSEMRAVSAVARRPRLRSAELGRWITDRHHGLLRSAVTGEADAILVAPELHVDDEWSDVVSTAGLRRIVHGLRLDGRIAVVNFHVGDDEQFRRVADLVDADEAIVAGDANVRPGVGATYEVLRERGFSAPLPDSIDQILVRGLSSTPPQAWPEERRHVAGRLLSDHAPVELTVG